MLLGMWNALVIRDNTVQLSSDGFSLMGIMPMAHDPSSASKLLVPESRTRYFAHLSCILVSDLSGIRNLDRIEHALMLPSFWYEILVPVTWTKNLACVP